MRIPYSNRTLDVDLPLLPTVTKITVKEVIEDFYKQLPNTFTDWLEAFVMMSPRRVRVTCKTARAAEELLHSGLSFQGHPIFMRSCKLGTWVHITRLSYGIPSDVISEALAPYGKVLAVKMDSYRHVHIGVRQVLIDLQCPIPSRLRIADHWCYAFYPGQPKTCFFCHTAGHDIKNCPKKPGNPVISNSPVIAADDSHQGQASGDTDAERVQTASPLLTQQVDLGDTTTTPTEFPALPLPAGTTEGDDLFYDAPEGPLSKKRDRSDDDLSDPPSLCQHKRERPDDSPSSGQFISPNIFSSLEDEAANTPLPAGDATDLCSSDNSAVPQPLPKPASIHTRRKVRSKSSTLPLPTGSDSDIQPQESSDDSGNDDGAPLAGNSFPTDVGLDSDTHTDNPSQPRLDDDDTITSDMATTITEAPSITTGVNKPKVGSTPSDDILTSFLSSKKTLPAPVFGSRKKLSRAKSASTSQ